MRAANGQSKLKGDLVEDIVARIHLGPNVTVSRNVHVPTVREPKRTREIDILVMGHVSGYEIKVAIECKNYARRIQAPDIDNFFGKLNDIGLPSQSGVFVSLKGFTSGALRRAEDAGIKTLVLTGLSEDRLSVVINDAVQSVVHLLATIVNINVTNTVRSPQIPGQHMLFYSEARKPCGSIPDLAWKAWIDGAVPQELGEHEIRIVPPGHWLQFDGDTITPPINISARLLVTGIVATFTGKAMEHALIDASGNVLHKFHVKVSFEPGQTPLSLAEFESEADIRSYIKSRAAPVGLVLGRMRIPKIRFQNIFWPPSPDTSQKITTPDFCGAIKPEDLERQDLSAAWDPLWDESLLNRIGRKG